MCLNGSSPPPPPPSCHYFEFIKLPLQLNGNALQLKQRTTQSSPLVNLCPPLKTSKQLYPEVTGPSPLFTLHQQNQQLAQRSAGCVCLRLGHQTLALFSARLSLADTPGKSDTPTAAAAAINKSTRFCAAPRHRPHSLTVHSTVNSALWIP